MIVFLGIFLRKDKSGPGNIEVSQFLDALMETTTTCSLDGFSYKRYWELAKLCYENNYCSGENACVVLNKYTKEMIEDSWKFGSDNVKKSYFYEFNFIPDGSDVKQPITAGAGPSSGTTIFIGSDRPIDYNGGNIVMSLELYLE